MFPLSTWSRSLNALRTLLAAALLCTAWSAHANTLKVGSDSKCTYGTIAEAVNNAEHNSGYSTIYIATNQDYKNQAIVISTALNSHITVVGGVPNCSTLTPAGSTTIEGSASASVITVRGSMTLTLSHLTITGGHGSSGGGIDYAAVGALTIGDSTIDSNNATYGGGIRFQGNGGPADLYVNTNTFVTNNTATSSGGGIRAEGQASVHIDAPQTWIAYNEALGTQGGGVLVVGPAYAHIGSPGYLFGGVIYQNKAPYGAGIALISESSGHAQADLLASDPTKPVRVEQNRATGTGGGVYLLSYAYMQGSGALQQNNAVLQMEGARIDDNAAQEGSGIYADTYYTLEDFSCGSEVLMYTGGSCGLECNSVSGNRAVTVDNTGHDVATAGSAILIQTDGVLRTNHIAMRMNEGAHAVRISDSLHLPLKMDTCLIADNAVTAELFALGIAGAQFNQCTVAYNAIGGAEVFNAQTGFSLTNSIIAQSALPTLHYVGTGTGYTLDYLLSKETATLGAGQHIMLGDASFVDANNGDFHLLHNSLGVDVAPAGDAADRDLDQHPRDVDLPEQANIYGPRDLGAYEHALSACDVSDTIFCNGFEAF
jgi:predicted outer membrane repeat protein